MTTIELIIFIVIGIAAGILATHYVGSKFYNYVIEHDGIRIKHLGFLPTFKIRFTDIVEIKIIPFRKANVYFPLRYIIRFGDKLWGKGAVWIRKNSGLIRTAIITPDDPHSFLENVLKKMG